MSKMKVVIGFLLILPVALANIQLMDFFPYGITHGDLRVPTADDNFVEVDFTTGHVFHFFNITYDKLFVNNNGGISFSQGNPTYTPNCGPSNVPMIIPYWADVNTLLGGDVFYRESFDPALFEKATKDVQKAYPDVRNLNVNWLFIATWNDAPFFGASENCSGITLRNQYQVILVTDGTKSFAIFYFNQITWTTGTASAGDCYGQGGTPAKSGFDLGDGQTFFQLPGSCTANIQNVTSTSNVNQRGKWIFRIDQSFDDPEEQPECNIDDCQHYGHCYEYAICNHETRTWEKLECSAGLYWNPPHHLNNSDENCTASCDVWDNLTVETQATYEADETCFSPCYYMPVSDCSGQYIFHSHKSDNRNIKLETCPLDTRHGLNIPLVWVQERETCDFCYNAYAADGSACCEKYGEVEGAQSQRQQMFKQ